MPPRLKQHWDMNTTKVCHLCCGIIMDGNNIKIAKSFNLFRTVMNNFYRYAKIDLFSLILVIHITFITKAANKIKR